MTLLLAIVVGFLAGRLLLGVLEPLLAHPLFARENYRGHFVITSAGMAVPMALVVVEGGRTLAGALDVGRPAGVTPARALVVVAAVTFGFLGLLDDMVGVGDARGFRGHVRELAGGRLTTGGMKLL